MGRPSSLTVYRASVEERRLLALLAPTDVPARPATRGDCSSTPRPCPWVGCKFHLYLDVDPANGTIQLNRPDLQPWELEVSCALDQADAGALSGEQVGGLLELVRTRVHQIERAALAKLTGPLGDVGPR